MHIFNYIYIIYIYICSNFYYNHIKDPNHTALPSATSLDRRRSALREFCRLRLRLRPGSAVEDVGRHQPYIGPSIIGHHWNIIEIWRLSDCWFQSPIEIYIYIYYNIIIILLLYIIYNYIYSIVNDFHSDLNDFNLNPMEHVDDWFQSFQFKLCKIVDA